MTNRKPRPQAKEHPIAVWIFLILFFLCAIVILVESGLDGASSGSQSDAVSDPIYDAVGGEAGTGMTFEQFAAFIRKFLGHFSLFAITAIPLMIAITLIDHTFRQRVLGAIGALVGGFSLAAISEFIQLLTPGRGPAWRDVGIDFGGFALTVVLFFIGYVIAYLVRGPEERRLLI